MFIIFVNYFSNKSKSDYREIELKYFNSLDLKLKGVICKVEKQTDTYKFLVTLDVLEANYEEFLNDKNSYAFFCLKKR